MSLPELLGVHNLFMSVHHAVLYARSQLEAKERGGLGLNIVPKSFATDKHSDDEDDGPAVPAVEIGPDRRKPNSQV